MNTNFFAYCAIGIIGVLWARYSSRDKAIAIGKVFFRSIHDDLSKNYFEPLLLLVYTIIQGTLIGLVLAFFVSSPIEYQNPNPLLSLYCLLLLPVVRINYEFGLVVYRFFKNNSKPEVPVGEVDKNRVLSD